MLRPLELQLALRSENLSNAFAWRRNFVYAAFVLVLCSCFCTPKTEVHVDEAAIWLRSRLFSLISFKSAVAFKNSQGSVRKFLGASAGYVHMPVDMLTVSRFSPDIAQETRMRTADPFYTITENGSFEFPKLVEKPKPLNIKRQRSFNEKSLGKLSSGMSPRPSSRNIETENFRLSRRHAFAMQKIDVKNTSIGSAFL